MHLEVLRGTLEGYIPTIVGRPVATGSMRNVLRMGEILALRGADDARSGWLREDTRGCVRKEGRNGATVRRTWIREYRIRYYLSSEKLKAVD
jgi:hypothetical protein